MDGLINLLLVSGVLGLVGTVMYCANQYTQDGRYGRIVLALHYLMVGAMGFLTLLLLTASLNINVETSASVSEWWGGLVLCGVLLSASLVLIRSHEARTGLSVWLPHFNPHSAVHQTALLLMASMIVLLLVNFVLGGGARGYASDLSVSTISPLELVLQMLLQVGAALVGVGLWVRRDWPQTFERLGLRQPVQEDWLWGLGGGVLLFIAFMLGSIVLALLNPSLLEQENSFNQLIAASFPTVPMAFLLAVCAGIGEEIWLRGAIQPIFGNLLTSIFFTLLHSQYFGQPQLLLLFGVSLAFGVLRQRQSTNAAILAHFMFNFIQMMLLIVIGNNVGSGI
jgi:uncharacterized protein